MLKFLLDSLTMVYSILQMSSGNTKPHACEGNEMLKIGDFSKLSRISILMLRHYDEHGLLTPASIDPMTGYRYYGEDQLMEAERIQALKGMGFALSVIREILEKYEEPEEMERFLLIKKKELEEESLETQQRIRLLENTLRWLRKDGKLMNYDVVLKTLPERYVASLRKIIPAYNQESILWQQLNEEMAPQNVKPAAPCYGMAIFHDEGYKESDVDVEIQIAVTGTYKDTANVKFKKVEPVQIASATYQGSYDQITKVNEAVAAWINDNGYEFDGASFCIYHVSPAQASSQEDLVTEVCYPVKKRG